MVRPSECLDNPKKLHKQYIASVVTRLHTASQDNHNGALSVKAKHEGFPKRKGRPNNND